MQHDSSSCPSTWMTVSLGDIVQAMQNVNPGDYPDQEFTYLDISSIDNSSQCIMSPKKYLGKEAPSRARQLVKKGDTLFSTVRTYLKNIALVGGEYDGQVASTGFCVLRPCDGIDKKFVFYLVQTASFLRTLNQIQRGSSYPAVRDSDVLAQKIWLPPSHEQHRIVTKIEELFSALDAGVEALKKAQILIGKYRSAVLGAVILGHLSSSEAGLFRSGRNDSARELLDRISEERRARQRKPKQYKEPHGLDTSSLPSLPDGWLWVRAEQVCDFITKGTTPSSDKLYQGSGEVPFIKVYNLTNNGHLDFNRTPTFVSRQTHNTELVRSIVIPGDVLMNIVGPPLGKVSIVPSIYPEWNMNQAIAVFRAMPSYNSRFLAYCLMSNFILGWAIRRSKATAGQFNLTLEICRDLPLPLPPKEEQNHIVAEIDRHFSVIEQLGAMLTVALRSSNNLRQSILRDAFLGRLTDHNSTEEAVTVLLERIKTGRPQPGTRRPRKRSRRAY